MDLEDIGVIAIIVLLVYVLLSIFATLIYGTYLLFWGKEPDGVYYLKILISLMWLHVVSYIILLILIWRHDR